MHTQAFPMQAMPPVHEGFHYRSVRGKEHLDFSTYITAFAEPPPPQAIF